MKMLATLVKSNGWPIQGLRHNWATAISSDVLKLSLELLTYFEGQSFRSSSDRASALTY